MMHDGTVYHAGKGFEIAPVTWAPIIDHHQMAQLA